MGSRVIFLLTHPLAPRGSTLHLYPFKLCDVMLLLYPPLWCSYYHILSMTFRHNRWPHVGLHSGLIVKLPFYTLSSVTMFLTAACPRLGLMET
jgi:hypothetical protein